MQQNNIESEGRGKDDLLAPKDWTMGGAISASTMFATICAAAIARGLKPGVLDMICCGRLAKSYNNTILQDKLTAVATNLHGLSVASGGICDLNLKSDAFMRTN